MAILDPACGSGSFLLGAYQYLLDWHLEYYTTHDPDRWERGKKPRIQRILPKPHAPDPKPQWRLTTAERKRILLTNIFGVDIDTQAVEVTKLSLLLKVLEGENRDTLQQQLSLLHQRALPDLANNIKCGNSLIGPDFYQGQQLDAFDEEEQYRINAFDWNAEFPEIIKSGGFDAVIGNPPYIRVRVLKGIWPEQADYYELKYKCAKHVWDIYLLFFEKAVGLVRNGGRIAFIVPIQTLHQPNCESVRELLSQSCSICAVADLTHLKVFQTAIVKNTILVCEKAASHDAIDIYYPNTTEKLLQGPSWTWSQKSVSSNPGLSLKIDLLSPKKDLCDRLRSSSIELQELCYVTFGLRSCAKGKGGGGKDRLITTDGKQEKAKPYLEGRDIRRFGMSPKGHFIRYIPEDMYSPRQPELFETPKIVSQSMLSRKRLVMTLDNDGYYVEQSLVCILHHGILTTRRPAYDLPLEFLLGVLNSGLESFYFSTRIIDYSLGGGLIHATPGAQGLLIIPKAKQPRITQMVSLVQRMLDLHQRLQDAKTGHERTVLERQIAATDDEIDQLVYELYGLTDDEITIVEGVSRR